MIGFHSGKTLKPMFNFCGQRWVHRGEGTGHNLGRGTQFSIDNSFQQLNFKLICLSCKNNTVMALLPFLYKKILKIASGHKVSQWWCYKENQIILGTNFCQALSLKGKRIKQLISTRNTSEKTGVLFCKLSKCQLGNKLNRLGDSVDSTNGMT